ncbi:DUF4255 domain-containing protein [Chitinophaga niabensis]|uniref:Pvc16 N-terminal domain-containing protein n=1 Tax=Chitinophaga niabensis TaxID=536979 RepID=A0A1N6HC25_9BACT|nr:DUF4255 domain-containing protein [Chitinophaga niabensis]SIO17332.1 Protein of unknown function [Chitinophaga niabensis]
MIHEALKFISDEVNRYLSLKLGSVTDPRLVLGNVAKLSENDQGGGSNPLSNRAILTLVNIEEDRVSRSPDNYRRVGDAIQYRNPKVFINLYCLFSVNRSNYDVSLEWLNYIIQFFQYRNVFTHGNSPLLHEKIDQLVLDMTSMNLEQLNQLWGVMGGKYYPSVLYKMRLIAIEDDTPEASGDLIREINITEQGIN